MRAVNRFKASHAQRGRAPSQRADVLDGAVIEKFHYAGLEVTGSEGSTS